MENKSKEEAQQAHEPIVGQLTGWAKVESVLRDIDRAKIDDCKEDIDTLLVFAGLFSGVMTGFIVQSYPLLQKDHAQVASQAAQNINLQLNSRTLTQGFLNTTQSVSIPDPNAPFQPPIAAIRVNILWFSSLILSLITVSFGMLVKQWLREYRAGDFVSPQARLRVRHFRNPGLRTWKVYEIAGILPIILQLSLGLFLLGLCIFTWEIYQSVGYASLTLVLGWLTCFILTTIAPLVSARCPYKTTFLKGALGYIRGQVRRKLHNWITTEHSLGESNPAESVWDKLSKIRSFDRHSVSRMWRVLMGMGKNSYFIMLSLLNTVQNIAQMFSQYLRNLTSSAQEALSMPSLTEANALDSDDKDREILLAVDRALLDDLFLCTVVWESYGQLQSTTEDRISFLKAAICHRIPQSPFQAKCPDLRGLSDRVTTFIIGVLADHLEEYFEPISDYDEYKLPRNIIDHPSWVAEALLLLCAKWRQEISLKHLYIIHGLLPQLNDEAKRAITATFFLVDDWKGYSKIPVGGVLPEGNFEKLLSHLSSSRDEPKSLSSAQLLYCVGMLLTSLPSSSSLSKFSQILKSCEEDADTWNCIKGMFGEWFQRTVTDPHTALLDPDVVQQMFSMYLHALVKSTQELLLAYDGTIYLGLLRRPEYTKAFWQPFTEATDAYEVEQDKIKHSTAFKIGDAVGVVVAELDDQVQNNVWESVRNTLELRSTKTSSLYPTPLELATFIVRVSFRIFNHPRSILQPGIRNIGRLLSTHIRSEPGIAERPANDALFRSIYHIDFISRFVGDAQYHDAHMYNEWIKHYEPDQALFCEDLLEDLWDHCILFAPDLTVSYDWATWWKGLKWVDLFRIRRLRERREQSENKNRVVVASGLKGM